jgi:hypothetical protein
MRRAALIQDDGQIPPHMPTLPKKNRHNGNNRSAAGNLLRNSRWQIRRHQLKKRERNGPSGIAAQNPQPPCKALKRLSPPRIARPVSKKHHPMRRTHRAPRKKEP